MKWVWWWIFSTCWYIFIHISMFPILVSIWGCFFMDYKWRSQPLPGTIYVSLLRWANVGRIRCREAEQSGAGPIVIAFKIWRQRFEIPHYPLAICYSSLLKIWFVKSWFESIPNGEKYRSVMWVYQRVYIYMIYSMAMSQNRGTLKIDGAWMSISPNMVIIGFDPSPYEPYEPYGGVRKWSYPS